MPRNIHPNTRDRIKSLDKLGRSRTEIVKITGCCHRTVCRVLGPKKDDPDLVYQCTRGHLITTKTCLICRDMDAAERLLKASSLVAPDGCYPFSGMVKIDREKKKIAGVLYADSFDEAKAQAKGFINCVSGSKPAIYAIRLLNVAIKGVIG